jgi:hypothetical protein
MVLQHEKLARDRRYGTRQRDLRQARRLRLGHLVERRRDATFGGDHIGTPLEQLGRQSRRDVARHLGQGGGHLDRSRRIARDQRLHRTHGIVVALHQLPRGIARVVVVDLRQGHVVLVAVADTQTVACETDHVLGGAHDVDRERVLRLGFDRQHPALRNGGGNRLPRMFTIVDRGFVLQAPGLPLGACAAPQIELPVGEKAHAAQAGAIAAELAATVREKVHRRVDRAAGELRISRRLIDARRGNAQIGVVRNGFAHQFIELRAFEGCDPVIAQHARSGRARNPGRGDLHIRNCLRAKLVRLWRRRQCACGECRCHGNADQDRCTGTHAFSAA